MSESLRVAYADPPYVGQAKRHYGGYEVNHQLLISYLDTFDGWALSCSSPSLRELLPLCPDGCRIAAWVKPFHVFKRGVRPAYAWEPVIFKGGGSRQIAVTPEKGGKATTPKDFVSCSIAMKKGLIGAKPEEFCYWLFDLLGLAPDDTFEDVFPGTGIVGDCWEIWSETEDAEVLG